VVGAPVGASGGGAGAGGSTGTEKGESAMTGAASAALPLVPAAALLAAVPAEAPVVDPPGPVICSLAVASGPPTDCAVRVGTAADGAGPTGVTPSTRTGVGPSTTTGGTATAMLVTDDAVAGAGASPAAAPAAKLWPGMSTTAGLVTTAPDSSAPGGVTCPASPLTPFPFKCTPINSPARRSASAA
jgi:hypothetical protein